MHKWLKQGLVSLALAAGAIGTFNFTASANKVVPAGKYVLTTKSGWQWYLQVKGNHQGVLSYPDDDPEDGMYIKRISLGRFKETGIHDKKYRTHNY